MSEKEVTLVEIPGVTPPPEVSDASSSPTHSNDTKLTTLLWDAEAKVWRACVDGQPVDECAPLLRLGTHRPVHFINAEMHLNKSKNQDPNKGLLSLHAT